MLGNGFVEFIHIRLMVLGVVNFHCLYRYVARVRCNRREGRGECGMRRRT